LAVGATLLVTTQIMAAENRLGHSLEMLAPEERLEQLCDYTAMARIRKDVGQFRPDRALANATAEPRIHDNTIVAVGGAFRSRGKWYELSFACTTTSDHMTVTSFHYTIGGEIPETKWASDGLWQ
jgi:hypothetical protein